MVHYLVVYEPQYLNGGWVMLSKFYLTLKTPNNGTRTWIIKVSDTINQGVLYDGEDSSVLTIVYRVTHTPWRLGLPRVQERYTEKTQT